MKYTLALALLSFFLFSAPAKAGVSLEEQLATAQAELAATMKESEKATKKYKAQSMKSATEAQAAVVKRAAPTGMIPPDDYLLMKQSALDAGAAADAQAFAEMQVEIAARIQALNARIADLTRQIEARTAAPADEMPAEEAAEAGDAGQE